MQRTYGWRRDSKEARQALGGAYRATRFRDIQFPAQFDLAVNANPAFSSMDQGQLGSCTAHALARCAWYGLATLTPPVTAQPSPLFQYQNELALDGDFGQDNGSTISQGVNALRQFGIPPESDWPYNLNNFTVKAPDSVYQDALKFAALQVENVPVDQVAIQDCIFNQRLPIAFGSDLFAQYESEQCDQDGIVQMPPAGASPVGGHAQCIRGWRTDAQGLWLKVNNSWSDSWGDHGCAWFPWNYVLSYFSDLWAIVKMS